MIENPVRFSKPLSRRAYTSIVLGLLLTASSASLALLVEGVARSNLKSEAQQRYLAASRDIPKIYSGDPVCHLRFFQINIPECAFGDTSSKFTIVLFGDSHAAHWFPALEKIAETKGLRLVSLTKTGCPSVVFEPYEAQLERPYTECGQWRQRAFGRIKNLKPIITILANSNKYIDANDPKQVSMWRNGLKNTFQIVSRFSGFVVIIRDTPWLNFIAPKCLSRAYWQGNNHSLQCVLKQTADNPDVIFDIESTELSKLDRGIMVDMTKVICPNMPCLLERDGLILYHDSHHLTATFSRHIADQLMEQIQLALPKPE